MKPIITSILDNDLYKFTMQNAVMKRWGTSVPCTYQFNNRRKSDKFSESFLYNLSEQIESMVNLTLNEWEVMAFREKCPYLPPEYFDFLKNFRFQPHQVKCWLNGDNDLQLTIKGNWHETILWEVPLMAIISELYFQDKVHTGPEWTEYYLRTKEKYTRLRDAGCQFSEFGTRRRHSYNLQALCIQIFAGMSEDNSKTFLGTSNVAMALVNRLPVIGTMAHEWIMGYSGLHGLKNVNMHAIQDWAYIYRGNLGIALTDTFGTKAFFADFDGYLARLYDGLRHDSGDPYVFADTVIKHYESLGLDPAQKKIIFSDGLDTDECIKIKQHCGNRIKCFFGIGTNITNDWPNIKALNMVIKLRSVLDREVVKISDNPGKATGDSVALAEAFKVFGL